jgi:LPXTG-motif cell wall-anchored protein
MKKLNYLIALIFISVMLWGGILSAQDQGTYIDNASPQDSSYTESNNLNLDENNNKGSGNTAFMVGTAVAIVGAAIVLVVRKKKKK